MQQLVAAFANSFVNGDRFETITKARSLAESLLNEKIAPGTPIAKLVDEAIEQELIQAARQMVQRVTDPTRAWEQCLDLYERQPALNIRTSTSILQQAYSTPVPIAYLAGKLAGINRETTVYEPTAGNGALLLLADPTKASVNELNPNRAAALRTQGFTVTSEDASTFLPKIEAVDRVITNPPFGSLKDGRGLTQTFRRGLLTTSQLDHAIALTALDLMKPQGRAVLILGGKIGDERSRTERYNTQLTRGFYRWLYEDAGYNVADHFSISGNLYRKQGTSFPINVIVIEGKGETQLKLPGVEPPRRYESYEALNEVLVHAIQQQQSTQQERDPRITLREFHAGSSLDTDIRDRYITAPAMDNSASSTSVGSNREQRGILFPPNATSGMANLSINPRLVDDLRASRGVGGAGMGGAEDNSLSTNVLKQSLEGANSEADGELLSDELSGATAAMPDSRTAVSNNSAFDSRARSELSRRHEFNRLVDVDESGREPALLSGLNTMSEPVPTTLTESEAFPEQDIENQVAYQPRSKASTLSTLARAASLKGLENK